VLCKRVPSRRVIAIVPKIAPALSALNAVMLFNTACVQFNTVVGVATMAADDCPDESVKVTCGFHDDTKPLPCTMILNVLELIDWLDSDTSGILCVTTPIVVHADVRLAVVRKALLGSSNVTVTLTKMLQPMKFFRPSSLRATSNTRELRRLVAKVDPTSDKSEKKTISLSVMLQLSARTSHLPYLKA